MKLLFLTLTATSLLSSPATPQDKGPSDRIKDLQKQRIDTLKQASAIGLKLYQSGRIEVGEVLEDRMTLLKAEIDATEKKADRIPVYTQAVDSLKQFEEVAKGRFDHGRGTEYALLRVRAKRLEVEVLLEQAKLEGK
jgi:outer membrane protein TolC